MYWTCPVYIFSESVIKYYYYYYYYTNVFVFNFINFWLGCSAQHRLWLKRPMWNGSLYCKHHIYVWFLVGWSCCPPFCMLVCLLLQPSVCLSLSYSTPQLCAIGCKALPGHNVNVDSLHISYADIFISPSPSIDVGIK